MKRGFLIITNAIVAMSASSCATDTKKAIPSPTPATSSSPASTENAPSTTGKNEPATYNGVWVGKPSDEKYKVKAFYISENNFPCEGILFFEFGEQFSIIGKFSVTWEVRSGQLIGVMEQKEKNRKITKNAIAWVTLSNGTLSGKAMLSKKEKITVNFSQFQKVSRSLFEYEERSQKDR